MDDLNKQLNNGRTFKINRRQIIRGLRIGLLSLLLAVGLVFFLLTLLVNRKYKQFLKAAKINHSEFVQLLKSTSPDNDSGISQPDDLTFLILGIDAVANRQSNPQMTDTIILSRLHADSARLNLISLPRDLWSEPFKTKINALYQYGLERNPQNPTSFPQEVISDMTGAAIDKTIIVRLDDLGDLIDVIGGIDVDVQQGFIDELFPKEDVDIHTETDPEKLYETVIFEKGPQHMSGARALKYIRSRHSQDEQNGTDLARAERQQQVIKALISKISNPVQYWQNPAAAGHLYRFYLDKYDQYLKMDTLISILRDAGLKELTNLDLNSTNLTVASKDSEGVIKHPENLRHYQNQWVYTVTNQQQFKNFVQQALTTLK